MFFVLGAHAKMAVAVFSCCEQNKLLKDINLVIITSNIFQFCIIFSLLKGSSVTPFEPVLGTYLSLRVAVLYSRSLCIFIMWSERVLGV